MATVVKIKSKKNNQKPTPLQKKLLKGPVMTEEQHKEFQKNQKWISKWKA